MNSFEKGRVISELNREGRVVVSREDVESILMFREGTTLYNQAKENIERSLKNQKWGTKYG